MQLNAQRQYEIVTVCYWARGLFVNIVIWPSKWQVL